MYGLVDEHRDSHGVVVYRGRGNNSPATLNNGETRASGGHWTVTSGPSACRL